MEIQGEITLEDIGLKSPILGVVHVVKFFVPQGATFFFFGKDNPMVPTAMGGLMMIQGFMYREE